jgi:hypothetical protein
VNLAWHLALAIVAQEILRKQFVTQIKHPFVLLPGAALFEELGINFLKTLWFPGELLLEPLDG